MTRVGDDIYLTPMSGKYDSVLVWLHGLGDSAIGYLDYFKTQTNVKGFKTLNIMGYSKVILLTAKMYKMKNKTPEG